MALSIYVRTAPVGSGAASDGNLFTGIAWRWRGLRCYAFPLYCTNPIHPSLGHGQMKLGEWKSRFQSCGLLLHVSSAASAGNQGLPGGGVGVATVASPLSCTNPRHPSLGHGRTALSFSRVHSPTGVAWPPMVTLSLGSSW